MKELLESLVNGDKTIDEVVEAIEKDQKNMVPRSRLNDKNNEIKDLQKQLGDRDIQLKDLSAKATGNEELQKQIQDLQAANNQAKQEYESKLQKQTFDFALDRELMGAKAKNLTAVKALLNTENIKMDGESLLGLNDQLDALKESDSYLFASEEQQQPGNTGGYNPGSSQKTNPPPPPKDGSEKVAAIYEQLKSKNKI